MPILSRRRFLKISSGAAGLAASGILPSLTELAIGVEARV
jgi:hypothetical protein